MNNLEKTFKVALTVILLLCLFKMPYGYYQLVRVIATFGFGLFAYQNYNNKNETMAIIFLGLGILFQPFFKIALGRELWNIVDVIVAIGLIISVIRSSKKEK